MEHRCGYRRDVQVEVRVTTRSGLSARARLVEVSGSGARLAISLSIPVGTIVNLVFEKVKTAAAKRLRLKAEIVRTTGSGYGLEWLQFAPADLKLVYQLR